MSVPREDTSEMKGDRLSSAYIPWQNNVITGNWCPDDQQTHHRRPHRQFLTQTSLRTQCIVSIYAKDHACTTTLRCGSHICMLSGSAQRCISMMFLRLMMGKSLYVLGRKITLSIRMVRMYCAYTATRIVDELLYAYTHPNFLGIRVSLYTRCLADRQRMRGCNGMFYDFLRFVCVRGVWVVGSLQFCDRAVAIWGFAKRCERQTNRNIRVNKIEQVIKDADGSLVCKNEHHSI